MDSRGAILSELLNIGEAMLQNGAEVKRVEDTLDRMGKAYGAVRMNVFVITSSIVITMVFADNQEVTQTRRILTPGGTDFGKLEDFNALSRRYCEDPVPDRDLSLIVKEKTEAKPDKRKLYAGSVLAAGSLAVFFGGNLADGLAAGIFAVLICFMQRKLPPFCTNKVIFNLICSFITGISICIAARLFPVTHGDKIIIGDIMLLIPGIAMTNAVRDVLVGDTISGIMRLIESLLWACSLACGFMAAVWLFS